jgi:hypothetical protein
MGETGATRLIGVVPRFDLQVTFALLVSRFLLLPALYAQMCACVREDADGREIEQKQELSLPKAICCLSKQASLREKLMRETELHWFDANIQTRKSDKNAVRTAVRTDPRWSHPPRDECSVFGLHHLLQKRWKSSIGGDGIDQHGNNLKVVDSEVEMKVKVWHYLRHTTLVDLSPRSGVLTEAEVLNPV